jgi:hypothetical protein
MPLTRAPGELRPDTDALYFPMEDQVGTRVAACITWEALADTLAAADKSQAALIQHFEHGRKFFEGRASRKYDREGSAPRLTTSDITV